MADISPPDNKEPTYNPTEDPPFEDTPSSEPDMDNSEPCESFTLDDSTLEHLLDHHSNTYSIYKTSIYHVSKHSSSQYGSLTDRGANGGLAGADVHVLEHNGRTVSVTGIGHHELPGHEIVTCAALINTNHGKVVMVMHEYAYYGRGNMIHLPGQIAWFKNLCDNKSVHVGGPCGWQTSCLFPSRLSHSFTM